MGFEPCPPCFPAAIWSSSDPLTRSSRSSRGVLVVVAGPEVRSGAAAASADMRSEVRAKKALGAWEGEGVGGA